VAGLDLLGGEQVARVASTVAMRQASKPMMSNLARPAEASPLWMPVSSFARVRFCALGELAVMVLSSHPKPRQPPPWSQKSRK
jgi:hypothetical protein